MMRELLLEQSTLTDGFSTGPDIARALGAGET